MTRLQALFLFFAAIALWAATLAAISHGVGSSCVPGREESCAMTEKGLKRVQFCLSSGREYSPCYVLGTTLRPFEQAMEEARP